MIYNNILIVKYVIHNSVISVIKIQNYFNKINKNVLIIIHQIYKDIFMLFQ